MLIFSKHVELNAQDVLFFVLNSNTLLKGVYVLTGLALSGDLPFSAPVLLRRQGKVYKLTAEIRQLGWKCHDSELVPGQ